MQNFKNVTKMLANQHQLLQAYLSSEGYSESILCQQNVPFNPEILNSEIVDAVMLCSPDINQNNTAVAQKVTFRGTVYEQGMYVLISQTGETLKVGEVELIMLKNHLDVLLVVRVQDSLQFPNLGLYSIKNDNVRYQCLHQESLLDFHPIHSYSLLDQEFLSLKYQIPNGSTNRWHRSIFYKAFW